MIKKIFFIKLLIIYLLFTSIGFSGNFNYYDEGKALFDKKQFDKSKFLFEKDIVFNPKNERSYLYLAKIFNENNNDEEQEINLANVLLLNPQNDEALYMFALLKIKQSDYNQAKELIDRFSLVCKSFCSKKEEMQTKLKKLTPEDAKVND